MNTSYAAVHTGRVMRAVAQVVVGGSWLAAGGCGHVHLAK